MIGVGVSGQAQLLGIAQGGDVGTRGWGGFGPLATGLVGVTNCDVGNGPGRLILPLHT